MNEGYSEITNVINRIKKKKIELESLLTKYRNTGHTLKIMDAILKVEGILTKAKALQMSINVKSYTSTHKVSSGILHSKLLKQMNQIANQEQEIIDVQKKLEKLVLSPVQVKKQKNTKTMATSWDTIDIPAPINNNNNDDNTTGEELISYAKTYSKSKDTKKHTTCKQNNNVELSKSRNYHKSFEITISEAEKNASLEIQDMILQFRKIRNDLDSVLSSYRQQKYRKRIMDLIIKIKADINILLSLQSSFKIVKSNVINHSATINYTNVTTALAKLRTEKQKILEKKKILKAKIAKEKREQKEYKPKKKLRETTRMKKQGKEKDTKMVNLLLKMGVLKKKNDKK